MDKPSSKPLLAKIQQALFLHAWPAYPLIEGRVSVCCSCGRSAHTGTQWLAHIADEVLPDCFDGADD